MRALDFQQEDIDFQQEDIDLCCFTLVSTED